MGGSTISTICFSHEDSLFDSFAISHDLKITQEGLHAGTGRLQCRKRLLEEFFHSQACLRTRMERTRLAKRIEDIAARYDELSALVSVRKTG